MVSCFISRLVILVFGTLYPAYASYKAVRTKNVKEYVKWMMYWIVFALFICAETFTDLFLSFWFPFYYEIKIITVIYLLSPATKGSSILYRKFVHPALIKKEQEIDEYIAKAKEQGYHTMLNLGSKGVTYATSLIMQTAIKGGGGLVSQLRRSYSLGDLNEEQNSRQLKEDTTDDADSSYDRDPRSIRRTHKIVSSANQAGLYFPEVEFCRRSEDQVTYRQTPSYEQMSSGYSSEDPFYCSFQRPNGEHLVRTGSLGPFSRVRTRAATKNLSHNETGVSQGGSTWSPLESYESQNETEARFNFPLSHSASFPLIFPFSQHLVMPEYQYQNMFGDSPQNQVFSLINHSQYSRFLNEKARNLEDKPGELFKYAVSKSSNYGFTLLENNFDNCEGQLREENFTTKFADNSFKSDVTKDEENMIVNQKENDVRSVVSEKSAHECHLESEIKKNFDTVSGRKESRIETKEKPCEERSGRYKKKLAPTPPTEELNFKVTGNLSEGDEEGDYFTPDASPIPPRKSSSFCSDLKAEKSIGSYESDVIRREDIDLLKVIKKSKNKTKNKRGDFSLQKKLHIPKMTFSLWHQKGSKQPSISISETSSIASVEMSSTKVESKDQSDCFIPLKEVNDEKPVIVTDESKSG